MTDRTRLATERVLPRSVAPTMLAAARLATRWDCSADKIYRMIERGELPCVRIGGMVRIPLDAVEAIENGREPCREKREATGSNNASPAGSGESVGLRIVERTPEVVAREMKARLGSSLPASSPSSSGQSSPRNRP